MEPPLQFHKELALGIPVVKFEEFDIAADDPFLDNYTNPLKQLNESDTGTLHFGIIRVEDSIESDTKAVLMRVTDMKGNDFINNMRFWAQSTVEPSVVSYNMAIAGSGSWTPRPDRSVAWGGINAASGQIPQTLPTSQNFHRRDGHVDINGIATSEASEWVYLNLTVGSNLPVGNYGGTNGRGVLRYQMVFDYGVI
jgi:hypothetical protein